VAENLDIQTNWTGGRVVDCSGLENPTPVSPETAEMADFCGSQAAQDAPFTGCSAADDGPQPGTPDLATLAKKIRPLPGNGPNRFTVDVGFWGISAPTYRRLIRLLRLYLSEENR
jgi:hypothetical protein